ncbi:unnamed protein product, partial [Urochloa humidicola]
RPSGTIPRDETAAREVTRSCRPGGDEAAARAGRVVARGRGVAARHIADSDGDRLPFFVHSFRRLLVEMSCEERGYQKVPSWTAPLYRFFRNVMVSTLVTRSINEEQWT